LFAGMLACAAYFTAETAEEEEIRTLADALYRRADWQWAQHGGATVASLPFAPEIVLPALQHFQDIDLGKVSPYGFKATFNPTSPGEPGSKPGWVCPWHYGLNQGPLVLMIENYRSGLLWRLMRQCPYLATGLRRAGFADGWL
jgi:hypothetical protein